MHMTPLPYSSDVINLLRKLGKRVFYVTNNSTKTREELVEKCKALKFEATKDDILCTSNLSARYLQSLGFKKKVYIIGTEGKDVTSVLYNRIIDIYSSSIQLYLTIWFCTAIGKELEQVNISYCGIGPDVIEQSGPYSVFDKDPEIGAVIVGFDEHFSYPKMTKAATYLYDPNVHFIGTNTDERFPVSDDVVIPGKNNEINLISV